MEHSGRGHVTHVPLTPNVTNPISRHTGTTRHDRVYPQRPWHVLPVQRRVLLFFNLNPICYYLFGWDYEHSDALLTEADMSASAAEQARASRALQHYSQSYMCWGVRGIPP